MIDQTKTAPRITTSSSATIASIHAPREDCLGDSRRAVAGVMGCNGSNKIASPSTGSPRGCAVESPLTAMRSSRALVFNACRCSPATVAATRRLMAFSSCPLPASSSGLRNAAAACGSRATSASMVWQAVTSARCKSDSMQTRSKASSRSGSRMLSRYSATELASSPSPRPSGRGADRLANSPIRRMRSTSSAATGLAATFSLSCFCCGGGRRLSSQAKSVRNVSRIQLHLACVCSTPAQCQHLFLFCSISLRSSGLSVAF